MDLNDFARFLVRRAWIAILLAFIGAGAVVRGDVPDRALMVGVPAKRIGWMCDCGIRLPEPEPQATGMHATCSACSAQYWIREKGAQRVGGSE